MANSSKAPYAAPDVIMHNLLMVECFRRKAGRCAAQACFVGFRCKLYMIGFNG